MSGDTLFLPDKSRVFQTGDHKEITGDDYTEGGVSKRGMNTTAIVKGLDSGGDPQNLLIDSDGHPQIDIVSSALPSGAATEATLATIKTVLDTIESNTDGLEISVDNIDMNTDTLEAKIGETNETAPASDTGTSALNGRLQRIAQRITSVITTLTDKSQFTRLVGGTDGTTPIGNNADKLLVEASSPDGQLDAFGRLRTSNLETIFDSKMTNDNRPLFWDDQEISGGSTTSTYNANQASVTLAVGATTAGLRARQTFQRFNYQPGKSQLVFMTGVLGNLGTGNTSRIGLFDENNGIFLENAEGTINMVIRSNTSGTPAEDRVAQSSWNLDTMDGNGASGITLDFSKTQILVMDYEWLGVGRVRTGFNIDGIPYYTHQFLHANVESTVYMSTPNLPMRYEIENDGTGAAESMVQICSSVASESGQVLTGIARHQDSGSISNLNTGNTYAMIGIRLKAAYIDTTVLMEKLSMIITSGNDRAHWELIFNPTVAGTFTYSDETNSAVQIATGASTNTITGGTFIDGGYFLDTTPTVVQAINALKLGSAIDGTVDEIVIAAKPITNNITIQASLSWRELL